MAKLIKRHLVPEVLEALQTSRIVSIVGPRQAGKSTLASPFGTIDAPPVVVGVLFIIEDND